MKIKIAGKEIELERAISEYLEDTGEGIKYSEEFKALLKDTLLILKLCDTFEKCAGEEITKDNMGEEKKVLQFIEDSLPILEMLGAKVNISLTDIRMIVEEYYIPLRDGKFLGTKLH